MNRNVTGRWLTVVMLASGPGCARHAVRAILPPAAAAPVRGPVSMAALPLRADRETLTGWIVDGLTTRTLRHRKSPQETARVATDVAPLVEAACRQPECLRALARIAAQQGRDVEAVRREWSALQEADLLLESSGDPDAVSGSAAVGVAQWLAGTARGHGLPVDVAASQRLTAKIDELRRQIAWFEYLQRPDANPALPGAPQIGAPDAARQLPAMRSTLEQWRTKRRAADARYDPRRAIFAQTRYLLGLYARFPSFDWLFQAYHGGEGGVQTTLRRYLAGAWPGSAAAAIRAGDSGRPLRFEDVYFTATPQSHADAFYYLYGRSDDHRHYWWKIKAAEQVLSLYRSNRRQFNERWAQLLPGRMIEAAWYPEAPKAFAVDLQALRAARAAGVLVPVTGSPELRVRPAPLDPANAPDYACLRPEAKGALLLLAAIYRRSGAGEPLVTGDLALTRDYVLRKRALNPPPPPKGRPWPPDPDIDTLPGGGPPADFDFHTAGVVFDGLRPHAPRALRLLQYALSYLEDRQIISYVDARDQGERRFHVAPNPRYAGALSLIAATGHVPGN